jgi:hypothetical protein
MSWNGKRSRGSTAPNSSLLKNILKRCGQFSILKMFEMICITPNCAPCTNVRHMHALHLPLAHTGPRCAAGQRRWSQQVLNRPAAALMRATSVDEGAAEPAELDVPTEFVEVGVVGAPHGVRGEMKVQPLTDFPEERLGTPGTRCASCAGRPPCASSLPGVCWGWCWALDVCLLGASSYLLIEST